METSIKLPAVVELINLELSNYIVPSTQTPTHISTQGHTVYNSFDLAHHTRGYSCQYEIMKILTEILDFEMVKTYSSGVSTCFSEKYLASVSWCEGDIHILAFNDINELLKEKAYSIEFYKHG